MTARNTTWTWSPAAIALVPDSAHALEEFAGIVHEPMPVVGDLETSKIVPLTNSRNVVPVGKTTLILLLAAADSPPVADAVKFRTYCVRAPAAFDGDALASVTALTDPDLTTWKALDTPPPSDVVETDTV